MARREPRNEPDLELGMPTNGNAEKRGATTTTFDERESTLSQGPTEHRRSMEKPQSSELVTVIKDIQKKYEEDHPDKDHRNKNDNLFKKIRRSPGPIRYAIYILPLWTLLAIPVAITCTIFRDFRIPAQSTTDGDNRLHLAGLFIWLEFVALGLWFAKSLSWSSIQLFEYSCKAVRNRVKRSALLLDRLAEVVDDLMDLPITLIIWAIVSYASTSALAWFEGGVISDGTWASTLRRVLLAAIVVSIIIWAERILICMSFVSYYSKRYDEKYEALQQDTKQIERLFDALTGSQRSSALDSSGRGARITQNEESWNHDRSQATEVFDWAMEKEESAILLGYFLGYSMGLTDDESEVLVPELKHTLSANDKEDIQGLTDLLNGDNDDDITFIELRTALKLVGRRKETLVKTLRNVSEAMESLDRPLSCLVLVAIAFIYAAFFVNNFNVYATAIFTAFTGLGFAISGTVAEFLGSCIFLFVKQPYAVGDKCLIKDVQLEVDRISLMTTKFIRVDTGKLVQLSHNVLSTLWIENLSRSKRLKEHFVVAVSPDTSLNTVDTLRGDISAFARKNHRDFLEDSIKIQLVSVSDMTKLELVVEIEHKFLYYDDELHSDRSSRFKWALLAFLKDRDILPPGVDEVVLGDPARPTFAFTSSNDLLEESLKKRKADKYQQKKSNEKAALRYRDEPRSGRSSALEL